MIWAKGEEFGVAGQEGSESGWRSKKFVAEGGRAFSVTRDTVELHFLEGRRGFISLSAEASLWRAIRCKLRCLPVLASARRINQKDGSVADTRARSTRDSICLYAGPRSVLIW